MASKAFVVFGVLLFMALLISAEVTARELAEENNNKSLDKADEIQEQKQYGGGGDYGRGDGGYNRGGGGNYGRGGDGNYGHGGGGNYGHGGGGNYGHGGGGNYGHGGGYYHGRPPRCYYGCCRRGLYSGCSCCATADEIPDAAYLPEQN